MRFLTPGLAALLLGFTLGGPARADHPLACRGGNCPEGHPLSLLRSHHPAHNDCEPPKSHSSLFSLLKRHHPAHNDCEQPKSHSLFSWLKRHHCKDACHGHGLSHLKLGECGYHPWFHTFRPIPDGAFPTHPFMRSPRDFFMYE